MLHPSDYLVNILFHALLNTSNFPALTGYYNVSLARFRLLAKCKQVFLCSFICATLKFAYKRQQIWPKTFKNSFLLICLNKTLQFLLLFFVDAAGPPLALDLHTQHNSARWRQRQRGGVPPSPFPSAKVCPSATVAAAATATENAARNAQRK